MISCRICCILLTITAALMVFYPESDLTWSIFKVKHKVVNVKLETQPVWQMFHHFLLLCMMGVTVELKFRLK